MADPSPTNWTLRLKSQKTTVLLHVNPLQTFTSIKSALYTALQETGLRTESGTSIPFPDSPSDIQLGRPVNINDPSAGFELGEWEYQQADEDGEDVEEDANGKGKGKAKANGRPKKSDGETATPANIKDCPKGAGLRDGAVLAFRWKGEGMSWEDEEDEAIESGKPDMWAVKIASFEDAYGVENEGDVGGGREFEG
jgi:hypothetical protein